VDAGKDGPPHASPSWIERYERQYEHLWTDPILAGGPPITWRGLVDEAARLGAAAERALVEDGNPAGVPPGAGRLLQAMHDAGLMDVVGGLPFAEGFHPRYAAVFEALPTGRRLHEALTAFVRVTQTARYGPDVIAKAPPDVADQAFEGFALLEMGVQHGALQWRHHGRRVYVLGRHTAELLARTDLPAMPVGELTLPMPVFYLRLPAGMYRMRNGGNDFPVDGVLVVSDRTDADTSAGRQLHLFACPDEVKQPGVPVPQWRLLLPGDRSVAQAVAEAGSGRVDDAGEAAFVLDNERDPIPNLVFGFLLYLMSEHPLLEPVQPPADAQPSLARNPAKQRRQERRWEGRTRLGFIRVGREAPPSGQPDVFREGAPPTHLVWVRGHWRNQAHGPRHALRRLTWIEPHTRGPDLAEQIEARPARVQDARPVLSGEAPPV
jgi:hypothetical protein